MLEFLKLQNLLDNDIPVTKDIDKAIYILSDGTLWNGGFEYGSRTVEHREVETFTKTNRYDGRKFWEEVTVELGLIMLIPESRLILENKEYTWTSEQIKVIKRAKKIGYKIEEFK